MQLRKALALVAAGALVAVLAVPSGAGAYTITADPSAEGDELVFVIVPEGIPEELAIENEDFDPQPGSAPAATETNDFDGTAEPPVQEGSDYVVRVTTFEDTTDEPAENVRLVHVGGNDSGEGTIEDDDPPALTIADATFAENATGPTMTITATSAPGAAVDIPLTVDGGSDVSVPSQVTLAADQTSVAVPLSVTNDTEDEVDEQFTVRISSAPTGATVADGEALLTITNDDAPTVNVADAGTSEGDGGVSVARFAVTLSAPSVRTVTVQFVTGDGTARAPVDYLSRLGAVTFQPGQTSGFIDVSVVGDNETEQTEVFGVLLTQATNARIDDAIAVGVITDDDGTGPVGIGGTGTDSRAGDVIPPAMRLTNPKVRGTRITMRMTCPRGEERCAGRVSLYTVPERRNKVRSLRTEHRIGAKSFRLRGGRSVTITIRIPGSILRAARRAGRLKVQAFAVTEDVEENVDTRTRGATLRYRRSRNG